jgi:hypothetical protein
VSAEAAVQGTLARYKTALESRDLGALKQIWPALVGRQEAAIKMEFDNARSIAVDFDNVNVRVTNTAATLTCRRNYVVTTSQGQTLKTASKMTMTLDRRNGSWVIDTIRHEVER